MKQTNQWLNEAKQLCEELGPEDGMDPRILARSMMEKPKQHKAKQLCKEAKHSLSLVLAGELSDPVLQNLDVVDVTTDENGQFLLVTLSHVASGLTLSDMCIENKLQTIQGFLRAQIAQSVKRKRVPALKFRITRAPNEVNNHAYSKNNK